MPFKPGSSGNPNGRPKGKTLGDKLRAAVTEDFDGIMSAMVGAAKGGDTSAAGLLLSRTCPSLKAIQQPVAVDLGDGTLTQRAESILAAVGRGKLSPDDAKQLLSGLGDVAKIIQTDELTRRIEALESRK